MAEAIIPKKAKLFIGIIFHDESILLSAQKKLIKRYGEIDYQSGFIPFNHTSYYDYMGPELKKVFFSFKKLFPREKIARIKIYTNNLERKHSVNGIRKINIDPGYLTLSNVFLASCKDFFHRVYIGNGVYIENEFRYVGKRFQPWEWTYPDYKKPETIFFFHELRKIYCTQL